MVTSYSKAQHPNYGHVPDAPDELEMRSFNGTGTGNPNHHGEGQNSEGGTRGESRASQRAGQEGEAHSPHIHPLSPLLSPSAVIAGFGTGRGRGPSPERVLQASDSHSVATGATDEGEFGTFHWEGGGAGATGGTGAASPSRASR